MIFFTIRWESCAGIRTKGVRWGSRVDGKDGFSERGVTCYPHEINVFVAGGRKTATGGKERGLRSETKACWYNEDGLDLYPIKVSSLKAKSFPNNGVIAPTTPSARQLGPIRKTRFFDCGLGTVGHSSSEGNSGRPATKEEEQGRDVVPVSVR